MTSRLASPRRRTATAWLMAVIFALCFARAAVAHPLGNFSINHFARLELGAERITIRYVVDLAEIPTFQELQTVTTKLAGSWSRAELEAYLERVTAQYADGLLLTIDGARVQLKPVAQTISLPPGAGGLPTLRVECDLAGAMPSHRASATRRLRFTDANHSDRIGWHEIVVTSAPGIAIFNSSAFGNGVTDELKAYPADSLAAPLDERVAELSFRRGGVPSGATALLRRDGRPATKARDRFAELIAVPALTPAVALFALLMAFALGGLHALSPGHGKTVVGAYLVGSRGTARHAAFLGLTVTVTHTAGVFALGLVTLFASHYIVPERLLPILSLGSGLIVLVLGLSLFLRRLRAALGLAAPGQAHSHTHPDHDHAHRDHGHPDTADASVAMHAHGGRSHSHLPPGADGSAITWRSLLALGISGGLLPCPSALVVMLSAISLDRVGFGLLLIVAFSLGLASSLTGVGLACVYAGRKLQRPARSGLLVRALPVASALVIVCAGVAVCYQALQQAGLDLSALARRSAGTGEALSVTSVLGLGLILGLKHALDADHLAAVSTIVSERQDLLSSWLVGGLWGIGHTISLLIAGVAVILLRFEIGARLALALEFGVALMLIGLGAKAIYQLARGGGLHWHAHSHGGRRHFHPHIHSGPAETDSRTHHGLRLEARPLIAGLVHGLAGSAALLLLVLSTAPSPLVGFACLAVFGLGSIGGMMLMSALLGLPVHLTAARSTRAHFAVRALAGCFSLGFGLVMVYQIGFIAGLFR